MGVLILFQLNCEHELHLSCDHTLIIVLLHVILWMILRETVDFMTYVYVLMYMTIHSIP